MHQDVIEDDIMKPVISAKIDEMIMFRKLQN